MVGVNVWSGLLLPAFAVLFSTTVLIIGVVRRSKTRSSREPRNDSPATHAAKIYAVLMLGCYAVGLGLIIYGVFAIAARAGDVPLVAFTAGGGLVALGALFTVLGWQKTGP
jgi:hypothetical protein